MSNIKKLIELDEQGHVPGCLVSGFAKRNNDNDPIVSAKSSIKFFVVVRRTLISLFCVLVFCWTFVAMFPNYFNQHKDLSGELTVVPMLIFFFAVVFSFYHELGICKPAEDFFEQIEKLSDYLNIPLTELSGKNLADFALKHLRKEADAIKKAQANKSENITEETIGAMRREFKRIHNVFHGLNLVGKNWAQFFHD